MNQKLLTKVLAATLAVILTFTNFVMLGLYTSKTYATVDTLENQKVASNNENVEFDAYFMEGAKVHTVKKNTKEEVNLYLSVNVKKGYLKNARVEMLGENGTSANFKIANAEQNLEAVESVNIDTNTIAFKQLNSGTQIVLEVPVKSLTGDIFDLSNFNKINNIKLTGSYVSNEGKNVNIEKTILIRNIWHEDAKPMLEQTVKSYIPFVVGEQTGTILQTVVQTGLENNSLPIASTQIEVKVPEVNGVKPEKVIVTANSTNATNSKLAFGNNNWNYDKTTGTVNITVNNEQNETKVTWDKLAKDEYVITYIFSEKLEAIQTAQTANLEIKAYNDVQTVVNATNTLNIQENEIKGNFIETEVISEDILSKGILYTKSSREVQYNEKVIVGVAYKELADKITVENRIDNFVNEQGEIAATAINTYYKTTSISKANFDKILGADGYIKLIGANGEQLAIFNSQTQADENGNYVYAYSNTVNQIKIETSKPVAEGKLEINNTKVLNGLYSKEQVESFKALNLHVTSSLEVANTKIAIAESSKNITLIAPSTKVETIVSQSNLSTVVKNENVEIRAILKTNDITCDLYKNPVVEIVLPSYIAELNIKDVDLLFDDELSIKDRKTYINENGNIVIQVEIEGEDTVYNQDEITKGANLIINTDITLKKLTPTKDDVIKVYVTNQNVTTYENMEMTRTRSVEQKGYAETSLKAVAPVGMVTTNEISNYNAKNETVTSISGEANVGKLVAKTDAKVATVTMNVINNYQNVVKNINILGRIPFSGNSDIVTGEALGSNLNLTLANALSANGIDASKVTIYYSQNGNATKDLQNPANGWTTSIEDLSTVKSYLIVLNDYEMATGTTLTFNYNINIPENLAHNMSSYATYVVYFDNVAQDGTTSEKAVATKVGLSTGEGPELQVSISSNLENGANVEEGKIITYKVKVRNAGKEAVKNVTVSGNIPEKTAYTYFTGMEGTQDPIEEEYDENLKQYVEKIDSLNVGEEKEITYMVKTQGLTKMTDEKGNDYVEEATIIGKAQATVESYDTVFTSNEVQNKLVEGYMNVSMSLSAIPESYPRDEGHEVTYIVRVENVNYKDRENTTISCKLPEGLTFKNATNNGSYNQDTRTITWNIGTLVGYGSEVVQFTAIVDKLPENTYQRDLTATTVVTSNGREAKSNDLTIKVQKARLTISQTSETAKEVEEGEKITYNVIVKNEGTGTARNVTIKDIIPEGLKYQSSEYTINGQSFQSSIANGVVSITGLDAGAVVDMKITAIAQSLEQGTSKKEITNIVKVTADGLDEITSNEVKHTIVKRNTSSVDDPTIDKPVDGTSKISGLAWLDANGNGRRDDDEKTLGNISVVLINAENGQIVKDITTGKNKIQQTNEGGAYTFANLKPGKYMVVFLYDAGNYGLTTYKTQGVNDNKNSDVVSMNVNMNGEVRKAGVSDKLELTSENIENIDMGLIINPQFDLRLDKVITKITVNDAKGTKEYNYKDSKFAKLDLSEKTINGSTIIVEYKIRITNEGGVAGYAKKVVDYLPKDMKFTSELNEEWYTSENGNIYNSMLANTLIAPGETKELTLLLIKQMTGENTGLINNVAEIAESYNDLGLADIDSTPGNKVQNEDDMSNADAMISIKTGEVYVYILITITSIAILGIGIYFINKKVLRRI